MKSSNKKVASAKATAAAQPDTQPASMSIGQLLASDMAALGQADRARKIAAENDILRQQALQQTNTGKTYLLESMPNGTNVYATEQSLVRPSEITAGNMQAGVRPVNSMAVSDAIQGIPLIQAMPAAPQSMRVLKPQGQTVPEGVSLVDMAQLAQQTASNKKLPQQYQQALRDLLMSSLVVQK